MEWKQKKTKLHGTAETPRTEPGKPPLQNVTVTGNILNVSESAVTVTEYVLSVSSTVVTVRENIPHNHVNSYGSPESWLSEAPLLPETAFSRTSSRNTFMVSGSGQHPCDSGNNDDGHHK